MSDVDDLLNDVFRNYMRSMIPKVEEKQGHYKIFDFEVYIKNGVLFFESKESKDHLSYAISFGDLVTLRAGAREEVYKRIGERLCLMVIQKLCEENS